jgi:hypothetical protein
VQQNVELVKKGLTKKLIDRITISGFREILKVGRSSRRRQWVPNSRVEAVGQPFGRKIERNLPKTGTYKSEPAVNLREIP